MAGALVEARRSYSSCARACYVGR